VEAESETLPRLMLVTDRKRTHGRELVPIVAAAVQGGVGIVQVREPDLDDAALAHLIERIRDVVARRARLLVNGRPHLAQELGIGLHLPARHPPLEQGSPARRLLHGRSAHDLAEATAALREEAAYVILGTIYPTESKPGRSGSGLDPLRRVAERIAPVPLFAIGGIGISRIPELLHAGAHGVAVCGAILGASDPRRIAQGMRLALKVSRAV
jgi:thiamine-phosphate pyrophosphorylase